MKIKMVAGSENCEIHVTDMTPVEFDSLRILLRTVAELKLPSNIVDDLSLKHIINQVMK